MVQIKPLILFLIATVILSAEACSDKNATEPGRNNKAIYIHPTYARLFDIWRSHDSIFLTVHKAWQGGRRDYNYILVPENQKDDPWERGGAIEFPVERVVCLSTTHLAMLEKLEEIQTVRGISGEQLVNHPDILAGLQQGTIKDVGYGESLNYEVLIRLQPDLVFAYGVEGDIAQTVKRLEETGIPVILVSEYLETHPLAKSEWILFMSAFFGKLDLAREIADSINYSYEKLASRMKDVQKKPGVFSGLPWKNTWYVPGGASFAARLIHDAGGSYVWASDTSSEALPMDMESVYQKCLGADIWINPGAAGSLQEISELDSRLSLLEAYQKGMVFNNDRRKNEYGGNDYWESGTVRPHIILQDLVFIFHPDSLPEHKFHFYRKLK